MHNHAKRGGGRRFNKSRFSGNFCKKYKSDVKPDQLSEKDVGITEYVSDLEGFSGILKARFSDFQVNEIALNGEVAKFTNTAEPEEFKSDKLINTVIPTETPCDDIPQDIWTEILAVVDSNEEKVVELDSTEFDKEKRGNIHRLVKSILQRKVVASTITKDSRKYLTFKKYNKHDKKDDRISWPFNKGEYVHFLVYKENTDTFEATLRISDCLKMRAASFSYAGVKDRRGKTTQWFSVRRVLPSKLLERTKCLRNIHVGNIVLKEKPLKLGKLQGNRFRIALRNITASDEVVNKSIESLKERGFINYYGLQRFGNDKEVPTYEIGIKLLQGKFKEACNLILKCKKCDNPMADISQAKKLYNEKGSAAEAVKLLRQKDGNSVETKLLQGLAKANKNDYVNALEKVPRNMRLLYIHAFQALIWNKMTSRRIKEFGLQPIVGDLVLLQEDSKNGNGSESDDEDEDEIEEKNENEENIGLSVVETKTKAVKILTQEDLKNYSIYDVVLPLPGYDITYPKNVMTEWYKAILEEYELTLEMPKQSVKTYTLSGDYRPIAKHVTNLSWKMMRYNDPNDDLIRSDFDEFLDKPEPEDKPDGQYKALIIDFCLDSSCYATMVVREILKTDTSTLAHTKLNEYHAKPEPAKITTAKIEEQTPESLAPNSLLSDPEKYEDFKRSIFGFTSTDDSLKRKLVDEAEASTVPEKKSKDAVDAEDKTGLQVQPTLV